MNDLNCNKIVVGRCRARFYTNSDNHSQLNCTVDCVWTKKNKIKMHCNVWSTSNCLTANAETGLEFSSCMTANAATTLEFLKLWHTENENANKICDCTMHCNAVLQELNSKSHLKCLAKHSNRKEQTCRTNKFTNRLTLKRIFLKEHVRH